MHKLSVMVVVGAIFTLGASADSINGLASPDRYAPAYLSTKGGRDPGRGLAVRVGRVEPFGRSVLVQAEDHSQVPHAGDFLHSKPVWNLMTADVTHSTDSFFYNGEPVTVTAPVRPPADRIPVPEPPTLGLVGVALAAIALMRGKRLA